ncbi:hypothetical protein T10_7973 [Trichinella papuae]|uniref:Uncharacterized protein n=1 Tax=Trichinella papuae TaxID=268474 RepID=A0A0V1M9A2_9BILA|nr:hypothetical protein T10_11894 [Trichinella papuae]KRZ78469.1 hypothetical protein T10_7973 [Trichinella papuae]
MVIIISYEIKINVRKPKHYPNHNLKTYLYTANCKVEDIRDSKFLIIAHLHERNTSFSSNYS